jgi:hypothetical protein
VLMKLQPRRLKRPHASGSARGLVRQRQGPMCFTTTLCRFPRKQKTVCVRMLTGHVEPRTHRSNLVLPCSFLTKTPSTQARARCPDVSGMAFVNYDVFFGGKFLNIFWTSLSRFFVFFSGLPDKSLLDAPLQISCLELPSNMLTIRVPTS